MATDPNINDRTPGTWTYFAKSTDYGTVDETVEYMGRVAEEPSLNVDTDEYDYQFSGWRHTVTDVGHTDESIDLSVYPDSDLSTLDTADITDAEGDRQFNVEGDYRIQVMREAEDDVPHLEFAALDTHWTVDEVDLANGPLILSLTGQVNGGFVWNPPAME